MIATGTAGYAPHASHRSARTEGGVTTGALPAVFAIERPLVCLADLSTAARETLLLWLKWYCAPVGLRHHHAAELSRLWYVCAASALTEAAHAMALITRGSLVVHPGTRCTRCRAYHEQPTAYALRDPRAPWAT